MKKRQYDIRLKSAAHDACFLAWLFMF